MAFYVFKGQRVGLVGIFVTDGQDGVVAATAIVVYVQGFPVVIRHVVRVHRAFRTLDILPGEMVGLRNHV